MNILMILISIGVAFILFPFVFWFIRNIFIFIFKKNFKIFDYLKWIIISSLTIGLIFIFAGLLTLL